VEAVVTGNVTDSYNVSLNGIWDNGTTDTFNNTNVGPSGWANITVFAYNVSGTGTLSDGNVSDNVQAPAAPTSCDCGDICVDETGWWRDGGVLNASGTPIQAAVDNAGSGETVCVKAGSYTENVNITIPHLTLACEGADVVNVTANQSSNHVFNVTADYVNISGFNTTGATGSGKAGIYLNSTDHCNISENAASSNYYGIYLDSSSNNTLLNNTASDNNWDGIRLYSSSNNNLSDNFVAHHNDHSGISFGSSSNYNNLTGNNCSNNNYGIYIGSSSNNKIYNNYFNNTNNAWDNGNNQWNITKTSGINIIGGPFIGGNYWSDYTGVDNDYDCLGDTMLPYNSSGNITNGGDLHPLTAPAVLSCDCGDICVNPSGWWRDGGALNASTTPIQAAVDNANAGDVICVAAGSYTENVYIRTPHLTLAGEGAGVVTVTAASSSDSYNVFGVTADYVNISGFNTTGATGMGSAGIYLRADHCNISKNTASINNHGIHLSSSSNNTLANNTASDNNWDGICLDSSSNNNTLTSNNCSNNDDGIRLSFSSNYNTLTSNNCSNNDDGIHIRSLSNNNTLLNNNAYHNSLSGIYLDDSSNNTLASNNYSNNTLWDIYIQSSDSTFTDNTLHFLLIAFQYQMSCTRRL